MTGLLQDVDPRLKSVDRLPIDPLYGTDTLFRARTIRLWTDARPQSMTGQDRPTTREVTP